MADATVLDEPAAAPPAKGPRRTRYRRDSLQVDHAAIVERIIRFESDDLAGRSAETEIRLQRTAKLRGWTEGKDFPWPDASDIALPDMLEQSLRQQDTLTNATLQVRPVIGATALAAGDRDKAPIVSALLDYQFFEENDGEQLIGELADDFVNDYAMTCFIPWVKETRRVSDIRVFDPLPPDGDPEGYFRATITGAFPDAVVTPAGDGWDWTVTPSDPADPPFDAKFYTRAGGLIELVLEREVTVFDGPRPMRLAWDEVLHPPRAANLQAPGPSNPHGAGHAIITGPVTVDEIRRLAKSGFYDLPDKAALDALPNQHIVPTSDDKELQKDALQGVEHQAAPQKGAESHGTLTRLVCFDRFDIDGDGLDEDVIFWVLKEPKLLLKAKPLTEMYPANPPRRPFARASFIPVPGRSAGISLPELLEGLHDASKIAYDQMVDAGTVATAPFGFYRASSGMRPEVIHMSPGELYPLPNPQTDLYFPTMNNNAAAFGINLLTLLQQREERVTMTGDLQLGRVPAGKASALRTAASTSMIANQGEARPERICRRWFMGLREIYAQMHELNRAYLPEKKKFLIGQPKTPSEDPYQEVTQRAEIDGRFQFTFSASVFNTSKQALQQGLQQLMGVAVTQIAVQLGLTNAKTVYNLLADYAKSLGQDPTRYFAEPEPGYGRTPLLAEEAMLLILRDEMPDGHPAEAGGAAEHYQKLVEIQQRPEFGHLTTQQVELYKVWLGKVQQMAMAEQQRAQMAAAATAFQQGQQPSQPGPGRPAGPQANPNPGTLVSGGNELLDKTMPTAGGGGNQGAAA